MKLLRYGPAGQEKPGLLDRSGKIRDLSGQIADLKGSALGPRGLDRLRNLDPESLPLVEGKPRLGPCVGRIGKFLCIGLNYSDHAAETGAPIPKEPIIFMKADTAISGPNDPVVIPKDSKKTDWKSSSPSSSARPRSTSPRSGRSTMSPASQSATTSPSASSRSSVPAPGTRARVATPSARSAPGSSPPTRSPTCRTSTCGSRSTASGCRTAAPRR